MISLWVACYIGHVFGVGDNWWTIPFVLTTVAAIFVEVVLYAYLFSLLEDIE